MIYPIPKNCKKCAFLHTGGVKDGKHDRWCCNFGRPAGKAIVECNLKGGFMSIESATTPLQESEVSVTNNASPVSAEAQNTYLTAEELAELIDCRPNSRACMRRWLTSNEWPFAITSTGFPKVSRAYRDARMSGVPPVAAANDAIVEPDFSFA